MWSASRVFIAVMALCLQGVLAGQLPSTVPPPHTQPSASESWGRVGAPDYHNAAIHKAADPYVFYDAQSATYYAYSTEGADPGWNFAIYHSPDLATWVKHPGGVLQACWGANMIKLENGQACWAVDWFWAPEIYHNAKTGWYFFFFAARLRPDLAKDFFQYSKFEEPSKIGVAISRTPLGPFTEIDSDPIDYYPFDPDYHDVNLIMDEEQMLPPQTLEEGETAPRGTYIPTIDPNLFFDIDGNIYLYMSRNAYRNWNWDDKLNKYIEESNIIAVQLNRTFWDDVNGTTMPEIMKKEKNRFANLADELPRNITNYNGTGHIGHPPRKDGFTTIISYHDDPQEWENYHVNDYKKFNGTKKDRRWSEGSTLLVRYDIDFPVYLMTYSCNNYEAENYGVGFATSDSPLGPFLKAGTNPILSQQPDAEIPIFSTGHGSVVTSPVYGIGAQDVTHFSPKGAELFYVHHARNSTTSDRALYTTRMILNETVLRVGADNALRMELTAGDQPLPDLTYPLRMHARCERKEGQLPRYNIRVISYIGAPFDPHEPTNRIVGMPGEIEPIEIVEAPGRADDGDINWPGEYLYLFDDNPIMQFGKPLRMTGVAYQRLYADGTWATILDHHIICM